jgi:hypothetical protein
VAFKESFRPEKVYITPHTGSISGASSGGLRQGNVIGKLAPFNAYCTNKNFTGKLIDSRIKLLNCTLVDWISQSIANILFLKMLASPLLFFLS